jgi:cytochrome c6
MKRIAVVVALALGLAGTAAAEDAKTLFSQKCVACHGPDGKGQTAMGKKMNAPDLTAAKLSEADAEKVIANGKGKMTAYKGKLSPEQIKSLAAYVAGGLK